MKHLSILLISLSTLSFTFGQTSIPNLMERTRESGFNLNPKHFQTLKSNGTGKIQLDSVILGFYDPLTDELIQLTGKIVPTFDQNGYPVTYERYIQDTINNSLIPFERREFSYNEDGNNELMLLQNWNVNSSRWEDIRKEVFIYDDNGNLEGEIYSRWDPQLMDWLIENRSEYTYYETGQRKSSTHFTRNRSTNQMVESRRTEYFYDENGYSDTITIITYWRDLEGIQWIPKSKYCYAFDPLGNELLKAEEDWDPQKQEWVERHRTENVFYYNKQDLVVVILTSIKEFPDTLLRLSSLDSFEYDQKGRLLLNSQYTWDDESKNWKRWIKSEFAYGTAHTPELEVSYVWTGAGKWVSSGKTELYYDENDNLIDYISSLWINSIDFVLPLVRAQFGRNRDVLYDDLNEASKELVKDLDLAVEIARTKVVNSNALSSFGFYEWDYEGENWISSFEEGELRYFYSPTETTSTESVPSIRFHAYPNPVSNQLIIEAERSDYPLNLILFDLSGRKLFQTQVLSNNLINIPSFPSGLYLLQVSNLEKNTGYQKIVLDSTIH